MATLNAQDLMGKTVYTTDGEKLGKAGQVYLDDQTGDPEWVTVNMGMFGSKETFIPIHAASTHGDGIAVPYTKDIVKGAPNADLDSEAHLSENGAQELYDYYELRGEQYTRTAQTTTAQTGTVGHDTSGPTTDDAMTRSEERLRVGTERVETGRARLRKYVTTETVTQTVPVTREHVTIEREAITDANIGNAMDGPAISEEEHEIVLTEERPVVAKETVPVERVRIGKETEVTQQSVSAEVRKENIELIDPENNTKTKR